MINHGLMLEIIEEREGFGMMQIHKSEKTMIEVQNYFDCHYRVHSGDCDEFVLLTEVMDELDRAGIKIIDLVKDQQCTDLMELFHLEGIITKIREHWVWSVTQRWLPETELQA